MPVAQQSVTHNDALFAITASEVATSRRDRNVSIIHTYFICRVKKESPLKVKLLTSLINVTSYVFVCSCMYFLMMCVS